MTPKENEGAAAGFSVTVEDGAASSLFLVGAENPNEIGAVLVDASGVASDAAGAVKLKPLAAGLSDATGALKLKPLEVMLAEGFSESFFASAAGTPKLKPLDEMVPAGLSLSFFDSVVGAPKLKPPAVIAPAAGFSASFFASAAGAPKLNPLEEIDPGPQPQEQQPFRQAHLRALPSHSTGIWRW